MLDLRYHVASLSAVFLALIVGILVGVGISGRGFVDKSERRNFENRIAVLQSRVDQVTAQKALLAQQNLAEHSFVQSAYPALMRDRLAGKRIALIVVGSAGATLADVRQAINDAGGTVPLYRVITLPVAPVAVRRALRARPGFQTLDAVGHELAQEWVSRGLTPIADAVSPLLVEEQRGPGGVPVDAAIVLGKLPLDVPSASFVRGLLNGLAVAGVPNVTAERTDTVQSQVAGWGQAMSTVDDIDTPSGKLALALLVGGAPRGHYGVKPTAEALLPRIESAP
jgi:hypothetical protein